MSPDVLHLQSDFTLQEGETSLQEPGQALTLAVKLGSEGRTTSNLTQFAKEKQSPYSWG